MKNIFVADGYRRVNSHPRSRNSLVRNSYYKTAYQICSIHVDFRTIRFFLPLALILIHTRIRYSNHFPAALRHPTTFFLVAIIFHKKWFSLRARAKPIFSTPDLCVHMLSVVFSCSKAFFSRRVLVLYYCRIHCRLVLSRNK